MKQEDVRAGAWTQETLVLPLDGTEASGKIDLAFAQGRHMIAQRQCFVDSHFK